MNPYDIHIAFVSRGGDGKRRPVLVLSSDEKEVAVFQITSQYDSKSAVIQSQYIPIKQLRQALDPGFVQQFFHCPKHPIVHRLAMCHHRYCSECQPLHPPHKRHLS